MAEPKAIALAPHCPFGPISLAASLHVDAATPNFLVQEQTAMGDGALNRRTVIGKGATLAMAVPKRTHLDHF
eukprot:SAG31_NODE_201_length_20535_cov_15.315081_3_plen_72_part_00